MNLDEYAAAKKPVLKAAEDALYQSIRRGLRRASRGDDSWYQPVVARARVIARQEFQRNGTSTTSPALVRDLRNLTSQLESSLKKTDPDIQHLDVQARAIAASVASAAISTGSLAAAKENPDLFKVWVNMEDDRVRATHRSVDPVPIAEDFTVGGVKMSRPGDMTAPIELWINCRCILGYKASAEASEMALLETFNTEGVDMANEDLDELDLTSVDDSDDLTVPWYGVLAPEGVMSGDRRKFAPDSLRYRDLPLPLAWQKTNMAGHDGSVVVGRIDQIWRDKGMLWGLGVFLNTPEADEAIGMLAEGGIRGVSVDVDDAMMAMEDSEGNLLEEGMEYAQDSVMVVTDGRICGATLCAIPAFMEAHVNLGLMDDSDAQSLAASGECLPCQYKAGIDETGTVYTREDYTDDQWREACILHEDGVHSIPVYSPEGRLSRALALAAAEMAAVRDSVYLSSMVSGALSILNENPLPMDNFDSLNGPVEFVKTEDGPGWLTHPVDTERLRRYWTKGKGALKIRWGVPGDFNRCRMQLAKYIKPQYLSGYCANRHYDALGFWPGRPVAAETKDFSGPSLHLVASAMPKPPVEWFMDPKLTKGSGIVVTDEGRVFGHLAEWSRCHIGFGQNNCTLAPKSKTNYAYYKTGYVLTDDGEVAVGHLTYGTGHAGGDLNYAQAAAHYDNTGTVYCDVACGEDQYGIWLAGWMRPGTTEEDRYLVRASAVSGDWRLIGGNLELVAGLGVNVPGFPIPRTELVASGGRQVSLVASGIVLPETTVETVEFDIQAVADAVVNTMEARARKTRMAELKNKSGRTTATRMKELRERVGR